jgi:hypothetical protein
LFALGALALVILFALAHLSTTAVHWFLLAKFCLVDVVHTLLPIEWTKMSTFIVDELVVTVVPAKSAPLPRAKIDCMP